MTISLQALLLVEKAELVQVCFTLRLRDQRSTWMQDGCKLCMDFYKASTGSCFMVTWIIFKNHLLEVGLTQNLETMALRMLTTVDLFYSITRENWHEYKFIEIASGWGSGHIRLHTKLEGPWPHYVILKVSWWSLHTRVKSCDHDIVRAQMKASKGRPNIPSKPSSVVTNSPV